MKSLIFQEKSNQFKLLAFATFYCFALVLFRIFFTVDNRFLFLIWNLFLAGIPWVLSTYLRMNYKQLNGIIILAIGSVWLLFFPNAPYILTDLVHLKTTADMPLWFDLTLILSYALTGLVFGFYSLADIEYIIQKRYGKSVSFYSTVGILFLAAFGVYLGRYLRWNSWDIVSQPLGLMSEIFEQLANPFTYPRTYGMTILLGTLLVIMYRFFRRTSYHAANQSLK